MSDKMILLLRRLSIGFGCVFTCIALFADRLGLSVGGFSFNQVLILTLSLLLILAGVYGRKFADYYKNTATMLLNILFVFLILDLCALFVIKMWHPSEISISERKVEAGLLDAMGNVQLAWGRYEPFVVWRADTSICMEEQIDPEGFRITPGSVSATDSYKVFVFGGSAVWGFGVPDSCTIPAYLLNILQMNTTLPVEMRNFGQVGYVSTQEVIELMFQIRSENIPDLVIFMDGMNDVSASYQSGIVGTHQNFPLIRDRVELRSKEQSNFQVSVSPILQALRKLNTYTVISIIRARTNQSDSRPEIANYATLGCDTLQLASGVADACLSNYRLVNGMANQWDFDVVYFWQPSVWIGSKTLTETEEQLRTGGGDYFRIGSDPAWQVLVRRSYDFFMTRSGDYRNVFDLSEIFNSVESTVFTDYTGVHLTPDGNRIAAESIYVRIEELGMLEGVTTVTDTLP